MKNILPKLKRIFSSGENIILVFLCLTFFIGIWFGLGIRDVIGDELIYVDGALRAIENHTILPAAGDVPVPYGTLTYFLNYILTGFFLLILLPFFKFSIFNLKLFILNFADSNLYMTLRLLNAVLAVVFIFLIYKFLKREISEAKTRIFLIMLLFTNMITVLVLHTGKMWVLSTLLVMTSFYFLYRVICNGQSDDRQFSKNVFWSVIFSWLALANFPLDFYALINIPILLIFFRRQPGFWRRLAKYELIGLALFIFVTALNFGGIQRQVRDVYVDRFPPLDSVPDLVMQNVSVAKSFLFNIARLFFLFPLMILSLVLIAKNKIANRKLFIISLIYFLVYFLTVSAVATFSTNFQEDLRYLFPLGFFMIFLIASFEIHFSKIFYLLGLISLIYFAPLLYFLSIPSTYNQAYDWIFSHLNNQNNVIISNVAQVQLPKNVASYLWERPDQCSTGCHYVLDYNLHADIKLIVVDQFSKSGLTFANKDVYYIEETNKPSVDRQLVATFKNNVNDRFYYDVDYNIGNYLDLNYFKIKNLGRNIYIYKKL